MELVKEFLTPLIKVLFIGGFLGFICFYFIKAFHNAWSKSFKFVWRYKIRRKPMPEKKLLWCMDAIEKGIGWYDAKKIMMVAGTRTSEMNETLWIYDKVILELNNDKEVKQNGRKHERSDRKVKEQSKDLPSI